MTLPGYFWNRWPYFAGKLSWDITTTQVNSALHPCTKSSTSFGWGKGGKVTSAGWQVTLCDFIWHVISCSGVVISITNCYIRFTLLLLRYRMAPHAWSTALVGLTTSHHFCGNCTGFQSISESRSRSWGWSRASVPDWWPYWPLFCIFHRIQELRGQLGHSGWSYTYTVSNV